MENKLEQLLNSLIEKGWIPRGDKNWENNTRITNIYFRQDENGKLPHIRMIVSKESGLWQFVCENELVKMDIGDFKRTYNFELDYIDVYQDDFQYRLIESALKDESELEDFLLQNIKVGNEQL